ncbi:MAG TPA: response regulator [Kofleriaceae bacterium]|nr:response regulator [Kofleriaceae bacterium]
MVGDRRATLRARFRASAIDRLRKTWFALVELHEGRADASIEREIARDLHGVKGDAGLLGYDALSAAIHAVEEVLDVGNPGRDLAAISAVLVHELEVIQRALEIDPGEPAAVELLAAVRARLTSAGQAPAPAAATSPAEITPPDPPPEAADSPGDLLESSSIRNRWLQVDVARVDDICDRLIELHTEFTSLANRMGVALAGISGLRWVNEDLDRRKLQIDELATAAWALRLSSVEMSLLELAQHARSLAGSQGKRVRVDLHTGGVEIERHILESIHEPLLHLVRNAIDHGLEPPDERGTKPAAGVLTLHASTDGSRAEIVVADDGRGIDLDRIRSAAVAKGLLAADARTPTMGEAFELLFSRGFSTRGEATEISGRGVGLDVVRRRIEELGGRITVTSRPRHGTRFTLSVPTTIGRERYVVFDSTGVIFGIPSRSVREILPRAGAEIQTVAGGESLVHRGEHLPYRALDDAQGDTARILVIDAGDRGHALGVPAVRGEFDLMRRPIDRLVSRTAYIVAAASLGDSRPVLIVAPIPFLRQLDQHNVAIPAARVPVRPRVLVVDDSPLVRGLVASLLSGIGYEVEEAPDGMDALDALARDEVHLVISDVEMPKMNGFDLLRRVRAQWPQLPVVMLTTRGSSEDRRLASSLGANAYVVKSHFEQGHLVSTVRRLLGQVEA